MINTATKQEIKEMWDKFFDGVLAFRREQDKIISSKCNELVIKLDSGVISKDTAITEYNQLNEELSVNFNIKHGRDQDELENIQFLEGKLDKHSLKEVRKYSKKIAKAIWRLKGINPELREFIKKTRNSC